MDRDPLPAQLGQFFHISNFNKTLDFIGVTYKSSIELLLEEYWNTLEGLDLIDCFRMPRVSSERVYRNGCLCCWIHNGEIVDGRHEGNHLLCKMIRGEVEGGVLRSYHVDNANSISCDR